MLNKLQFNRLNRSIFLALIFVPKLCGAITPQDAERFTHLAGINLSDTLSLQKLQTIFGASQIKKSGDAGDYDERICYRTADEKSVIEYFNGEIDWGFVIRAAKPSDTICPVSPVLKRATLGIAGVELGMTKDAYLKLLGSAARKTADSIYHSFSYTHNLTDAELSKLIKNSNMDAHTTSNLEALRQWDVGISFKSLFANGRLVSFSVDREETN